MRILVTNDDGIDSEGMHALARSARSLGHEVTIVAPNFDASGTGASLGPLSRKRILFMKRIRFLILTVMLIPSMDRPHSALSLVI